MTHVTLVSSVLRLAGALGLASVICITAPAGAATTAKWKAPRTADGAPDLQGYWTNATITPLERDKKYGDRLVLTAQEAGSLEHAEAEAVAQSNEPTDPSLGIQDLPFDCGRGFTGVNCGYNAFWVDPGTLLISIDGEKRNSIVIDPADGQVPQQTAEARERMAARLAAFRRGATGNADGPEVRSLGERCLLSFGSSAGPPMLPLLYNNNYQIVQTPDTVLIFVEMVHDARIVRMNAKHLPSDIRPWMGDSIGHWEGDTLVIETTHFNPQQSFRGASENLKVTERLTRNGPNQIVYRFTIEDPTVFSRPWSGELAFNTAQGNIYEYACHEGNYALPGILAGAREAEREAAAKPK